MTLLALGLAYLLTQSTPAQRMAWRDMLAKQFTTGTGQPAPVPAALSLAPPAAPPRLAVTPGTDTVAIDGDGRGQFETTMLVRGREIPVLIDTGASYVALTYQAAADIGIHPAATDFRYIFNTANGTTRSAAVVIPDIRVGNVEVHNVQAFVSSPGTLTGESLLGMSFLRKLSGFEIQAGRLVLRQ